MPNNRYDVTVTSFWPIFAQKFTYFYTADLAKNFEKIDVTLNFFDFRITDIFVQLLAKN